MNICRCALVLCNTHWPCCSTLLVCIHIYKALQTYHGNSEKQPDHMQMIVLSLDKFLLCSVSRPLAVQTLCRAAHCSIAPLLNADAPIRETNASRIIPMLTSILQSTLSTLTWGSIDDDSARAPSGIPLQTLQDNRMKAADVRPGCRVLRGTASRLFWVHVQGNHVTEHC